MTRHFDQRAIERAAVILRIAERYSGDELDAALKAARRAIEYCLKEARAGANASRVLIEAIGAVGLYCAIEPDGAGVAVATSQTKEGWRLPFRALVRRLEPLSC
jgi:hypothetical protein